MPKKLIIGISVALVLVSAIVFAVLLVRSRSLTEEVLPSNGVPPAGGGGSTSSTPGTNPTVPQGGPCGDGVCSEGESWCKPDCGSVEDRFLGSVSATDVTANAFKIAWKTGSPSTGEVSYGLTNRYEIGTVTSSSPALSHAVQISGLSPGTSYFVRVRATEEGGVIREAADLVYETPAAAR